jgi:Ca-activated chloride channel family protein
VFLLLAAMTLAQGASARDAVRQGNQLYADGQYSEAINKYNEAEIEQPAAVEPKFNKANSYYRLDDLGRAIDLYRQVAAESRDMTLVSKAKYNLGNCFFQRGSKQRDSNLQKALEDMETSITYWRGVLDIDPQNEKAARNIEVARLTIKDILDQIRQQQQQEQEQQQQSQQDQQGDQQEQDQQQQSQSQPQDPNESQDEDQSQQGADPNQDDQQEPADQQQQQDQGRDEQQVRQQAVPDTTAQEILDKEQRQKEQRQIRQRTQTQKVERDW